MSVNGLKSLKAKVNQHQSKTAKSFRRGLIKAGAFLQRESMKVVPVDTDVLRPSANTRWEGQGLDTEVIVSYGTEYGLEVHENLEMRHKPGKTAKYLEGPFRENRQKLIKTVLDEVKKDQ
jgi:hypothetical protein